MKKLLIAFNASALLLTSLFQANALAEDSAAIMNINGTVGKGVASACGVKLNKSSVKLTANVSTMINQNEPIQEGEEVVLTLDGNAECYQLAEQGKLIYKFTGQADNADGTVLANSYPVNGAARGIGIGIYYISAYSHDQPLRINKDSVMVNPLSNVIGLTLVKLNGQDAKGGNIQGNLTVQVERL